MYTVLVPRFHANTAVHASAYYQVLKQERPRKNVESSLTSKGYVLKNVSC